MLLSIGNVTPHKFQIKREVQSAREITIATVMKRGEGAEIDYRGGWLMRLIKHIAKHRK